MLENLRQNKLLIEKGKKFRFYYFLIESAKKIDNDIEIGNIAYLYVLEHIDFEVITEGEPFINEIKKIWELEKTFNMQSKSYILVIKVVNLVQKEVHHPVTKLSQVVDPEIGIGISPSNICDDLLNIFTLYFHSWFKLVKQLSIEGINEEISLIKKRYQKVPQNKEGKDLTLNLTTICGLREDQFYLIQKSLSRLNQSLKSVDDDLELGLVLLVSTIENLSRKYGEAEEEFDEKIEFYLKLKKIFANAKYKSILEGDVGDELFTEIGNAYINLSYLKTKNKYKNFSLIYISPGLKNEKFEEMIENLYVIRSKVLHAGKSLVIKSRNKSILYNLQTRAGNIKSYSDDKGKYANLIRIPAYNDLLKILSNVLRNFIQYLYSVKDDKKDMSLYKKSDTVKRNIVTASINKGGFKPGYVVNLESDFYRRVDYVELIKIKHKIKEIEKIITEGNYKDALEKLKIIFNHKNFSTKYYYFRCACYLKIKVLHNLNDFKACLQIFEDYQIKEINEENILYFNLKAYCLAKLDEFQKAHELIDDLLTRTDLDELKACFLDSKGDFFQLAGDFQNAVTFYNNSLDYKHDPPFAFHEETRKKIKDCEKLLGLNI